MKNWILALIAGLIPYALLAQPEVESQTFEIGSIEVTGLQQSEPAAIIALTGLEVGDKIKIPGLALQKAIKNLWSQELFTDIRILETKRIDNILFLEIQLKEWPRISSYRLAGLNGAQEKEARNITSKYIANGTVLTENKKNNLTRALRTHFEEKGFLNTGIRITVSGKDLLIQVLLPSKQKVADITFSGNKNVKGGKLRRTMTTKSKAYSIGSTLFSEAQYEEDKKAIIDHYRLLGFRDAQITNDKIHQDQHGDLLINITIEEGSPYFFGDINWKGNSVYPIAILNMVLDIKKGDIYNYQLLEERLYYDPTGGDISTLFMDNGYLFFHVEPIETGVRGDTIDLELRLSEGPQATIGNVHIEGNERTKEHVIRRELRTQPGETFSRTEIIRSQREIINLGYFNPESLDIKTDVNPEDGTVDITYKVEEDISDKVELAASIQPGGGDNNTAVVGTLGLSLNNFSLKSLLAGGRWNPYPAGDGQQLSFRLQSNGRPYQAFNFSFTEPWLGGKKPISLTFGGFYQRFSSDVDLELEGRENLSVIGGNVQLGNRLRWLNRNLVSITNITYQNIDLNGFQNILLEDGTSINQGNFNNLFLRQELTYSTLADPFFPKKGLRVSLSGQFTPPYSLFNKSNNEDPVSSADYSWLEYHKWRLSAEWHKPVIGKLVFKASAKMGWLGSYNNQLGTPPFERFELGGSGLNSQQAGFVGNTVLSLRGYEADYLEGTIDGGGASFSKFSVELRYPLFNAPAARGYILGFAEGGNIWKNNGHFNPFDLRRSVGLGVRFQLPMFGTIGFDYGIGLDKPELNGQHWSKRGTFNIILGFEPE